MGEAFFHKPAPIRGEELEIHALGLTQLINNSKEVPISPRHIDLEEKLHRSFEAHRSRKPEQFVLHPTAQLYVRR